MIGYEEAIKVLKELREKAEFAAEHQNDFVHDFQRHCAEEEKLEIVRTLLNLDLEG